MEKYKKTVGSFLRYQYLPHLAAAVVFQIGAGAILSFRNLDAQDRKSTRLNSSHIH